MKSYKAFKRKILKDKEMKRMYDQLGPEFALITKLIEKRLQRKITQASLAKKVGTKQSAISRFEAGSYHPTLSFLHKVANALDADLKVRVV